LKNCNLFPRHHDPIPDQPANVNWHILITTMVTIIPGATEPNPLK